MPNPETLKRFFELASPYQTYVKAGPPDHQANWAANHARVSLSSQQVALLGSFTRYQPVLVISGTWCGDCAQQVPIMEHIAIASKGKIDLRIIDRDKGIELSNQVKISGGNRVPTVIFMNEEFDLLGLYGDNVLTRMRAKAAKQLGASCELPSARISPDELALTIQEWVDQFERTQLIARLSTKLRAKHGD
ncbi:MAG: thioredoxin family protein [Planctomycetes bacterium]|nr:thioredoxin family protein [Planctomycetota bacterium]